MKVLILYHVSHQNVLMDSLCENINKEGLYADSFDTTSVRLYSPKGKKMPFCVRLYKLTRRLPRGKHFLERLFLHKIILFLIRDYDIIDIQSLFLPMYKDLVTIFKEKGKKVKVQMWGTDFYQYSFEPSWYNWQKTVLENADIIQVGTKAMKNDFDKRFPELEKKLRIGNFGNQHLDDLIDFKKHPEKNDLSFLSGDYKGKLIVTCGYNAYPRQQHIIMIEAINKLPSQLLDYLYVIFPMTYLRDDAYLKKVNEALKNVRFKYEIINNYMTEHQLFSLRMITDLYVNIIKTDVLSGSTQEHLFCGNAVIVGEWLPYNIFDENKLCYKKTSLSQLSYNIYDTLVNIEDFKRRCVDNQDRLYAIASWKSAVSNFVSIYREMYNLL